MRTSNKTAGHIEKYRQLVQKYIGLHVYGAALFWADKVVALTDSPKDVYYLAQCMYLQKQYHRAAHLLQSKQLDQGYILCAYMAAKCLFEANEYDKALKVINLNESGTICPVTSELDFVFFEELPKAQTLSSFLLLKGKILEAMDNRGLAAKCYKQALNYDVYCFEALNSLVKYQMLTAAEERELLRSIPIADQCANADEIDVVRTLYEARLKKYDSPQAKPRPSVDEVRLVCSTPGDARSFPATPTSIVGTPLMGGDKRMRVDGERCPLLAKLADSIDMRVAEAETLYYNCDYRKCAELTEQILKRDPYHDECLPVHISNLVELKLSNKLFSLGHKLVDLYPNLAISWFAVGCYYYTIGKRDCARRYLAKATHLDRLFGPAWLAYGHSFAVDNEHDQAMAAYFKASQLMSGCHLPLLYIGLECGLTNNVRLAEKFFQQAQTIAPDDPFIMHEKGVICYHNQDYEGAELNFRQALERIETIRKGPIPAIWAPLLNNLGHTCRRLKKFDEALTFHHKALLLNPEAAGTFAAIAYVHVLIAEYDHAIDWFHKALGLKRDDAFSTTMLNYVIEHWCDDKLPYNDCPAGIPRYEPRPRNASKSTASDVNVSVDMSLEAADSGRQQLDPENENQNDSTDMSIDY